MFARDFKNTADNVGEALVNPASLAKDLSGIFTSGGVSPDFFSKFPLLAFLDNSTNHWKSRLSKMKGWTPNERIAWYINAINEAAEPYDAVQYSQMFGLHAEHIDDTKSVDFDLALAYNKVVTQTFFPSGTERITSWQFDKYYVLLDLSKTNKANSKYAKFQLTDNNTDIVFTTTSIQDVKNNDTDNTDEKPSIKIDSKKTIANIGWTLLFLLPAAITVFWDKLKKAFR